MNRAAIAIGSNSTRLLIAECTDHVASVCTERADTKLFSNIDKDNLISDKAIDYTVETVNKMIEKAREYRVVSIDLIGTSASRDASNSDALIERIEKSTGLCLHIITGKDEASLAFMAVHKVGQNFVVDIGGGSTEVSFGNDDHLRKAVSIDIGSSRLLKLMPINSVNDVQKIREYIREDIRSPLGDFVTNCDNGEICLTGIGGACTTLCAIMNKQEQFTEKLEDTFISLADAENCLNQLSEMTVEQRMHLQGLPLSRVLHIPHGLCILVEIMAFLNATGYYASSKTNMHGLLQKYCY